MRDIRRRDARRQTGLSGLDPRLERKKKGPANGNFVIPWRWVNGDSHLGGNLCGAFLFSFHRIQDATLAGFFSSFFFLRPSSRFAAASGGPDRKENVARVVYRGGG